MAGLQCTPTDGITAPQVILQDDFAAYRRGNLRYTVRLTPEAIVYVVVGSKQERTLALADVLGCHTSVSLRRKPTQANQAAFLCIYSYPLKRKLLSGSVRTRVCTSFRVDRFDNYEQNCELAEKWRVAVRCLLAGHTVTADTDLRPSLLPSRPTLLVLLNPFGGQGKAKQYFDDQVLPMMGEADVSISVVTTEYSGHAFDVVQTTDLSSWGGIVVVSGDGLLYEVVNGLMSRPDWEQAIKIPLGILPAGSGNGLCYSINYALGEPFEEDRMFHSTFVLLKATMKGHTRPLDLMSVDTASQRRYAFLSFQWGFSADVDIESERYRYLGGSRFLFGSLHNLMKLRVYRGKLSFLPVEGVDALKQARQVLSQNKVDVKPRSLSHSSSAVTINGRRDDARMRTRSVSAMNGFNYISTDNEPLETPSQESTSLDAQLMSFSTENGVHHTNSEGHVNGNMNTVYEATTADDMVGKMDGKDKHYKNGDSDFIGASVSTNQNNSKSSQPCTAGGNPPNHVYGPPSPLLPPLDQPVPANWVTIDTDFVTMIIQSISHISEGYFSSPCSSFDDGVLFLSFLKSGVSRRQMLKFMGKMAEGTQVFDFGSDGGYVCCKAFRVEPVTPPGLMTLDGEKIHYGPVQGQVHHGMINLIMPND
ncbi:PREDICTED: sphingosine kinase 2-like [Branchiostoma belcheri]|uniref:sphingosine kinase n=1 Tax=Branchiostoma belcheri TaxID=7741 RepID=A0A6P4ZHF6_BRABE|nr:PREDICTED: sphingosine kinase 2-like [Branchiostoma belcheri]